jgi:Ca2+-binding RTX toxin-like protein
MKRAILIAITVLAASAATPVRAAEAPLNVLLVGGPEANTITISLSADGSTYEIDSPVPLEVGGSVCWHPPGAENVLLCEAPQIVSFEVNAGAGDDSITVLSTVQVSVTLRGESGNDKLAGGAGNDRLYGGVGDDRLNAGAGYDLVFAGSGDDSVIGGYGDDKLAGGGGRDHIVAGAGDDQVYGGAGDDDLKGSPGNDTLSGGGGHDLLSGDVGDDQFIDPGSDTVFGGPGEDVEIPGGVVA